MKNKIFTLLSLSILALVMVAGLGSATITFSNQTPSTLPQESGSFTFTIDVKTNEIAGENITAITIPEITDYSGKKITFTAPVVPISITTIPTQLTIDYNVETDFDFFGKEYTATLTAEGSVSENATQTLVFSQTSFCEWGEDVENPGELKIKKIDITNKGISSSTKFGDDENWFHFEEFEVEVTLQNKGKYDVDDIKVEWGLYNTETGEWTIEVDEEDEFNLRDGDDEVITFKFKLDDNMDEDLDELGDGPYRLYVRATGQIDDSESPNDEDYTCISDFAEATLTLEKDFVILDNIQMTEKAACGTEVQITADVWNIGSKTQEGVYVIIYDDVLGISKKVVIGDLDSFEDEKLDALISIPQDAEEGIYYLTFAVYDEDGDIFVTDDDDEAKFKVSLKVEGNCISEPKVSVSVDLESEARAGKELILKVTLTNTGAETGTFDVTLGGYMEWATLGSVSPESVTLTAGESKDVLVTLNVNSDALGNQNFGVVVTEGTKVLTQPVSVMIEKGGLFGGITGGLISEGNWPVWTIGAINVVLIFVIILVALKVAKKQ